MDDDEKYGFDDVTASISNETDDSLNNYYDKNTEGTNSEYSVGSGKASFEMAQYLDHVESSEAVPDICSFQDVDLGDEEDGFNRGSNDGDGNDVNLRRAKRAYYLLPMLIRYKLPVGGCVIGFTLLVVLCVAIAGSVSKHDGGMAGVAVEKPMSAGDNAAATAAAAGESVDFIGGGDASTDFIINDAPSLTGEDIVYPNVGDESGEESVSEPLEFTSESHQDVERPSSSGSGGASAGSSNTGSTNVSTNNSASSSSNNANGSATSSSSNHPKWYSTSHPSYQSLLNLHTTAASNISPHHTAALFCNSLSQQLCTYADYCPSGKSQDPYNGGPAELNNLVSEEWEQWAPLNTGGGGGAMEWVQVGKIVEGAGDDDYFGRCWRYHEWEGLEGSVSVNMESLVGVEHRRWILCCDEKEI